LYYIRAYATNSAGTAYGNETSFTTYKSDAISDMDGNYYNIVTIGTQTWMAENLKTTKYNDNTPIPLVTDPTAWANLTTPGYCWYNNDATTYKVTYGALYNWFTVNTGKLCPTGWHVPTDGEWSILSIYLGGESVAGGPLKETGTTHWNSPNTGATNVTGFTGLPGGYRYYTNGVFAGIGLHGNFWSATETDATYAYYRDLQYNFNSLYRALPAKVHGLYVRCVMDMQPTVTTTAATNILQTTATSGGNVTSDGGAAVTARGVCWNSSGTPTTDDSKTTDGSGTGTFTSSLTGLASSTTYYIRAYATNSVGTAYGNEVSFTTSWACGDPITDSRDSKTYNTVQIGTQCWLKQNLNIGTRIDGVVSQTNNSIIEKHCYNNIEDSCTVYGGLYQWDEMMQFVTTEGAQGICPSGYHIPAATEWNVLRDYLGGESVAGGKMKEVGTRYWESPNTGASNSSGFSARGAGTYRPYSSDYFYLLRQMGIFWTSTRSGGYVRRDTDKNSAGLWPYTCEQYHSFSVRCIKDL
jgi:uncharacterized protein (TIGR02145 family)